MSMNKKQDNEAREKQFAKLIETGDQEDEQAIERGRKGGQRLRAENEELERRAGL